MASKSRQAPDDLPARPARRNPAPPQEACDSPKGPPDRTMVSEPLRQEAERHWAESDQAAEKRTRRTKTRVHARTKQRQAAREKDEEIGRLRAKLDRAQRGRTE